MLTSSAQDNFNIRMTTTNHSSHPNATIPSAFKQNTPTGHFQSVEWDEQCVSWGCVITEDQDYADALENVYIYIR